jgi:hypothetical protein
MAESKAVRVNRVDFRTVVESSMRVPAVGTAWPFLLGLHVTNTSDKPRTFYSGTRFSITGPDGKPLKMGGGTDRRPLDPVTVEPGKAVTLPGHVPYEAALQWTPDGKTLELRTAGRGGSWADQTGFGWSIEGLKPGRYLLSGEYELKESPDPAKPVWLGKVKTQAVAFEIVEGYAGLNRSTAVHRGRVDFQAVVESKRSVPPPGGRQPIDIGLGITNGGEKPLLFNGYDTIRPALRSAAEALSFKAFKVNGRRTRSFIPGPILVGPGKTGTIWRRAHLEWLPDGKTLRLIGPDGAGGTWYFDGLVPGKYLLSFEHENTEASLAAFLRHRRKKEAFEVGQSFWTGKATTNEIVFEVAAAK